MESTAPLHSQISGLPLTQSVFSPDKFQLIHFTRQRGFDMTQPVHMNQETITPMKSCKYLGLRMDKELNWKAHIQHIKTRASKSIGAPASLAGSTWCLSLKDMRKIYQAVVAPQMMYGCSAWSIARDTGAGYTRQTIDTLNSLQAKAGRIISGAFKATSGPALDIELYLLPMTQQLWKHNAESIGRLCSSHDIPALGNARAFRRKKRTGRFNHT